MRGSEPTWADLDDDLRSCVDDCIEGWPGGARAERLAARFADRAAAPVGGREPGTTGAKLIAAERQRQIDAEGWTPEHDASHKVGQLARAAECYVSHAWATLTGSEFEKRSKAGAVGPDHWPWWHWKVQTRSSDPADDIYGNWIIDGWKPSDDPIRDLVKAGALIAAEIDRLLPPAAVGGGEPRALRKALWDARDYLANHIDWEDPDAGDAAMVTRIDSILAAAAEAGEPDGGDMWSNTTIGGVRQTWRQVYEHEVEQRREEQPILRMVADLDRCPHGRHEGDICSGTSGCDGPSLGNPHLRPGQVIGYDLGRRPYVVPGAVGGGVEAEPPSGAVCCSKPSGHAYSSRWEEARHDFDPVAPTPAAAPLDEPGLPDGFSE